MFRGVFVLFCCCNFLKLVLSGGEHKIVKAIFHDYDSRIRPVRNTSSITTVYIFPVYLSLLGMDTAQETIQFNMDYKQTWIDEYLQWNASDFDGVESIRVPEEMIWTPDTYLDNSLEIRMLLPLEKRKVQIFHNGSIIMFNPQIVDHNCKMKVDKFPYDSQKCNIQFTTWSYGYHQLNLQIVPPVTGDTYQNIMGNSEWQIVYFKSNATIIDSVNVGSFMEVRFILKLKRNSVYYICVLLIPSFIIVTLCLLGIFAPSNNAGQRQEKVTLGLTTLLTMAVILNIVADQMPKATKLPTLGYFVMGEILMSTLAILISIVIMFLHERALSKYWIPPDWLLKLIRCKQKCTKNSDEKHNLFNSSAIVTSVMQSTLKSAEFVGALKVILEYIEERKRDKAMKEIWDDIFDSIDLIFLATFQIANITLTACLIL